jgi:chemotaxis methyl-accepting protein methylase
VLERMASVLAPDGILILDPTEHLGKAGHLFAHRADSIYSSRPTSGGRRELVSGSRSLD